MTLALGVPRLAPFLRLLPSKFLGFFPPSAVSIIGIIIPTPHHKLQHIATCCITNLAVRKNMHCAPTQSCPPSVKDSRKTTTRRGG